MTMLYMWYVTYEAKQKLSLLVSACLLFTVFSAQCTWAFVFDTPLSANGNMF